MNTEYQFIEIRKQLVNELHGEAVSIDTLSQAMHNLSPEKTTEEFAECLEKMSEGIRCGREELKKYADVNPDEAISDKLAECLKDLSPGQRKGCLLMLFQMLFQNADYADVGDLTNVSAAKLADQTEDELIETIGLLIKGNAAKIGELEAGFFHQMDGQEENIKNSEEEQLLTAAAIYLAAVEGIDTDAAKTIGTGVGIQTAAADSISDFQNSMEGNEILQAFIGTIMLIAFVLLTIVCMHITLGVGGAFLGLIASITESKIILALALYGTVITATSWSVGMSVGILLVIDRVVEYLRNEVYPLVREKLSQVIKNRETDSSQESDEETESEEEEEIYERYFVTE